MGEWKRMLRLWQVEEALGIKKSAVWKKCRDGTLCTPVRIGIRAVAWPSDEIRKIVEAQIAGCSEQAIKTLVCQLVAERTLCQ
jgi:prophage regulatory protein